MDNLYNCEEILFWSGFQTHLFSITDYQFENLLHFSFFQDFQLVCAAIHYYRLSFFHLWEQWSLLKPLEIWDIKSALTDNIQKSLFFPLVQVVLKEDSNMWLHDYVYSHQGTSQHTLFKSLFVQACQGSTLHQVFDCSRQLDLYSRTQVS